MGQAFMVIGDVCQMSVQCAGLQSPADYMLQMLRVLRVEAGKALSLIMPVWITA